MTPVYLTSTYAQKSPGEHQGFEYSRTRTRRATRSRLPGGARRAQHGLAFGSGCATADAVMHLSRPRPHRVLRRRLRRDFRLFDKVFKRAGLVFEFVDLTDAQALDAALARKPSASGGDSDNPCSN